MSGGILSVSKKEGNDAMHTFLRLDSCYRDKATTVPVTAFQKCPGKNLTR